ncbi:Tetracenomycin polyketide synthesis O-methyltransferase TcmP [Cytospora mali]|uniref:Tetracenomycin polyketide synthesis O-methyltransferase TcmP n=1 Tax=Cytospora mali TaxID=578113 RepID=A0A194V8L7_CYTMA|nr:Tetracenomycin polyketide synthesis O-methyltransferase TcmP [Valsa mali var. pyri (nom. inval.)]
MYKTATHSTMNIDPPDSRRSSKSTVTSRLSERPREKVRLQEVELTLLPALLWKSIDAQQKAPLLGDPYAQKILDRLEDLDLEGQYGTDERWVRYASGLARQMDDWTADFLAQHPDENVTVLHLACGLDARDLRVRRDPERVRWVDVDRPLVANLRERLFTGGESEIDLGSAGESLRPYGDYSLRSLNVTEGRWYSDIPADRPTLIVAEGLFPFLTPEEAERVIRGLLDYFGRGTLVFDVVGSLAVNHTKRANILKPSGSRFQWAVDDAKTVTGFHPKLKLKDEVRWYEFMRVEGEVSKDTAPPWFGPKAMTLAQLTSAFKDNGKALRFEF